MCRLLGLVFLAGIMATVPALAQSPMSPIYPTGPVRPQRPPVATKEIAPAPDRELSKAQHPIQAPPEPAEEQPIATAVIPPPAEPKKPVITGAKPEVALESDRSAKHRKRSARRTNHARRLYTAYPTRWYYDPGAAMRGWGGGQFGPSPYSSNGQ